MKYTLEAIKKDFEEIQNLDLENFKKHFVKQNFPETGPQVINQLPQEVSEIDLKEFKKVKIFHILQKLEEIIIGLRGQVNNSATSLQMMKQLGDDILDQKYIKLIQSELEECILDLENSRELYHNIEQKLNKND